MTSSEDKKWRESKVTEIELAMDVSLCRRSWLYESVGDFICESLESAKKRRGFVSRDYLELFEREQKPELAETCSGFFILVRSDFEYDADKDSASVDVLTKRLRLFDANFYVPTMAFTNLGDVESGVAAEVNVVVFLPLALEISSNEDEFDDCFLDIDGEGGKSSMSLFCRTKAYLLGRSSSSSKSQMTPSNIDYVTTTATSATATCASR